MLKGMISMANNKVCFHLDKLRVPSLTIYLVDTLIVWTDPESKLDIALSFQDADGCEDTWQFICEVQKHLISVGTPFLRLGSTLQLLISTLWRLKEDETQMPSSSSPIGGSPMMVANAHMVNAEHKLPWQPPTLANIR